jgi:hypothetical protein
MITACIKHRPLGVISLWGQLMGNPIPEEYDILMYQSKYSQGFYLNTGEMTPYVQII